MDVKNINLSHASMIDKWIIDRFNHVLANVTANMEKYEFALVGNELYSFVWDDFCSWYIELSKASLQGDDKQAITATRSTLVAVLRGILCMLHPFMPFVSEEIYLSLPHDEESINLAKWPQHLDIAIDAKEASAVAQLITMIEAVREIKTAYQIKPSADISVIICDEKDEVRPVDENIDAILQKMCHAHWCETSQDEEMVVRAIRGGTLKVAAASIVDVEAEIAKLSKEVKRLAGEIKRSEGMLNNPGFVNKAPADKVQAEKEKLEAYRQQYEITSNQLKAYQKK